MYSRTIRAPTDAEAQGLRRRLAVQGRQGPALPRVALVAFAACGVLWGLTVLATKLVFWPSVAWTSLAVAMTAWIWGEGRIRHAARRRRLEGAITGGQVDEVSVTATEVVELAEIEDLGTIWAFQVAPGEVLILEGRQDAPRGFPASDFSLNTFLDAAGAAIDATWVLRGARLRPVRTITVEAQRGLRRPEDLEVLTGNLEGLERLLGGAT
jgi:hypothetical protein